MASSYSSYGSSNTGRDAVCIFEQSKSGATFAIGDVASGPSAGTYYGLAACPSQITGAIVASSMRYSWDASATGSGAYSSQFLVTPTTYGSSYGSGYSYGASSSYGSSSVSSCGTTGVTVRTAVAAYRARIGSSSAQPTIDQLVSARLLVSRPLGITLVYIQGRPYVYLSGMLCS